MEKIFTEESLDMMEQKLTQYQNLMEQKEKLQKWLARAEEHRSSVDDKIYRKVKAEYDEQLSEAISDLTPIEKEIREEKESAMRRLAEAEEELESLRERQAETAFRHRIGEYDEGKRKDIESSLIPLIDEKARQEGACSSLLKRIDETLQGEARGKEEKASRADELISGLADPVEDYSAGMDIEPDTGPFALETEHPQGTDREADPSGIAETVKDDREAKQPDEDQMIPFPNLIIISGSQSGKKIPLLPMTMTIGREHDNNIELKDEEVARYHARVMYGDNRFVLQDLNSSTGTWVNGEKITQASLNNKDKIRFGKTEMVIDFS